MNIDEAKTGYQVFTVGLLLRDGMGGEEEGSAPLLVTIHYNGAGSSCIDRGLLASTPNALPP
jgi:hypothetical protein